MYHNGMATPRYQPVEFVVALIKSRQGTQSAAAYARTLGISPQFLSDVYKGLRGPSKEMLDSIGYVRVLTYRPKREGEES
jgi:hypothetical protein